jgi:mRNA interferase YafQ
MKTILRTSRFDKDVKKMKKRGKSFAVFKQVIENLAQDIPLEPKFKDHKLIGDYVGARDCHIEPDWVLIYENHKDELVLIRTSSHADLFG